MRRLISLMGGVVAALCLSQFPEFAQQYEQRLGGAIDELRAVVADFDTSAAKAGLSREQALASYSKSNDEFLGDRGRDMARTFARLDRLQAHLGDLQTANPVEKAADMARYYDPEIAARTFQTYQPAVPVGPEGIGFGIAGLIAGYALVTGTIGGTRRLVRRRRHSVPS